MCRVEYMPHAYLKLSCTVEVGLSLFGLTKFACKNLTVPFGQKSHAVEQPDNKRFDQSECYWSYAMLLALCNAVGPVLFDLSMEDDFR